MLSFASAAVGPLGKIIDTFSATLSLCPTQRPTLSPSHECGANPASGTGSRRVPVRPDGAIRSYVRWVRALEGEPVFCAPPLAMDAPWMDHDLRRFAGLRLPKEHWTGERLFYDGRLRLRSFASGRLGWSLRECTAKAYGRDRIGEQAHTHRALDDAMGYAHRLAYLLKRPAPRRT